MTTTTQPRFMPRAVHVGAAIASIIGTLGIATVSFILSFTALTELVDEYSSAGRHSWMWAVALDGLIIVATIALVALAGTRKRERAWATTLLSTGVILSTVSNVTHAVLAGYGIIGGIIAAVPPLMLAAIIHLMEQLVRHVLTYESRRAQASAHVSGHEPVQERSDNFAEFFESAPDEESAVAVVAVSSETYDSVQPGHESHTGEVASVRSIQRPSVEEVNQWIWDRIDEGNEPTGDEIGERYNISPATGRRWKTRALAARLTKNVDADNGSVVPFTQG